MSQEKNVFQNYFTFKGVSKVVKTFVVSDVLIVMARLGLVSPLIAVYITDKIPGGNLEVVGIATTIYLLTKSLGQIPAASLIDKISGEKDDFWAVFIGSLIFSAIPLLYILVAAPWQLYVVQFIYGVAGAFIFPAWMAIFGRHMDKDKAGLEWGVYFSAVDLSTAVAAAVGGYIATNLGFNILFVLSSVISFIGSLLLINIYHSMRMPVSK